MKKFWIVNKINPGQAEILVYGYIGPYDISASDFIIELSQLASIYSDIKIRINSGGGSIFEGIAIYNAIRSLIKNGKNISTAVDGIAASMGGVIAIAGKTVTISKYGKIMTHRASGYASGDADQIRQQADLVEAAEKDIIKIFAERTGLSEEDVQKKFMQSGVDNWLNAAKCIEYRLADEVYDADPVSVPENVTDEKQLHNIFSTCLNKSIPQSQNKKMKEIIAKLLGLPEDASEAQIENALKTALEAKKTAEAAIANHVKTRAENLANEALTAKKITADKVESVVAMATANYDATKAMLELVPASQKPTDVINQANPTLLNGANDDAAPAVTAKAGEGWDKLYAQGAEAIVKVKNENPELYRSLYKDKYRRDPATMGLAK